MADRDAEKRSARSAMKQTTPEIPSRRGHREAPFAIDVADPAPELSLPNDAGQTLSLSSLRGAPVLVVFAPADAHVRTLLAFELVAARRELGRYGATAILVIQRPVEDASALAQATSQELVILADASGEAHRAWGVLDPLFGRPRLAVFLVDAEGNISRVWSQPDPARSVALALEALSLAR